MQFVNGAIALVFVYLVLVPIEDKLSAGACVVAILLSVLSLRIWTYIPIVSLFALISSGLMFFFLGHFLNSAPSLDFAEFPGEHVSHLVAAFLLIPIISEFTSQSKANDESNKSRLERRSTRNARLMGVFRSGRKSI